MGTANNERFWILGLALLIGACGDDNTGVAMSSTGAPGSTSSVSETGGDSSITGAVSTGAESTGAASTGAASTGAASTGAASTQGDTSTGEAATGSSGAVAPAPVIDTVEPAEGIVTTAVTISGSAFGDNQGIGDVTIDGVVATITGWTDTAIELEVPNVLPGVREIVVTTDTTDVAMSSFDVVLPRTVYVSNELNPDSVSAYAMSNTGALAPILGSPFLAGQGNAGFGGDASSVLIDRNNRRLFLAGNGTVAVFDIHPISGVLSTVPGSPFTTGGFSGYGLTLTEDGDRLYIANCGSGNVSGFGVTATGALVLLPGSPWAVSFNCPDTVHLMQSDSILAVTDEAEQLWVYIVGGGGGLTPTADSPIAAGSNYTSRVNAAGTRLYMPDFVSGGVLAFDISAAGAATTVVGSPFIAPTISDSLHSLQFTPDQTRLYVGEWGGSNIFGFDVDGTGALSDIPSSPFDYGETVLMTTMRFTRDGAFMVLLLEGLQQTAVFSVANDGTLTPVPGSPFDTDVPLSDSSGMAIGQ